MSHRGHTAALLVWALTGCNVTDPTEVLLTIDAQPALAAEARTLALRVFSSERDEIVLTERRALPGEAELPVVLPLVPRDGDASRTFLVEAVLEDAGGAQIAIARGVGGYVEGEIREAILCFEDLCRLTTCGDTLADCSAGATTTCTTCRAGAPTRCESAALITYMRGATLPSCGAPTCTPTVPAGTPETGCTDGVDDDCDETVDCADTDCDGASCGGPGEVCAEGRCACTTTETSCMDGVTNDCDADVDCADEDCAGLVCDATGRVCDFGVRECLTCLGDETPTERSCTNGEDDDCDGRIDCLDADCCVAAACAGELCHEDGLRRCCGGTCVFMDRPDHCGGCDVVCQPRPSGGRFECVRVDGAFSPPRFGCRCTDGVPSTCPASMNCAMMASQTLCQCTGDAPCGAGLECRMPTGEHNFCAPTP